MSLSPVPDPSVLDTSGLNKLKQSARMNSPEAARAAARQFEGMFIGMVMKSMREATPSEGLLDSEQGKMMTGMLDQQMAQAMAARGVGLADVLARQLTTQSAAQSAPQNTAQMTPAAPVSPLGMSSAPASFSVAPNADTGASAPAPVQPENANPARAVKPSQSSRAAAAAVFADRLGPHAEAASAASGIPARFMLAQAALESGWGRREIRHPDGSNSHNVFGIKAGSQWKGKTVDVVTTEYVDGVPEKKLQRFRAYDSYTQAFSDYAAMLSNSPRYAPVVATAADAGDFARGLQKAGYATDPRYAQKLMAVIRRV